MQRAHYNEVGRVHESIYVHDSRVQQYKLTSPIILNTALDGQLAIIGPKEQYEHYLYIILYTIQEE